MKALLLALLLPAAALAQSPKAVIAGSDLTLSWVAPTTYTDGTPITDPITYNLYNNGVLIASGLTSPTSTRMALAVGNPCYSATAVVDGVESVPSSPCYAVSVIAKPKTPSAPGPVSRP